MLAFYQCPILNQKSKKKNSFFSQETSAVDVAKTNSRIAWCILFSLNNYKSNFFMERFAFLRLCHGFIIIDLATAICYYENISFALHFSSAFFFWNFVFQLPEHSITQSMLFGMNHFPEKNFSLSWRVFLSINLFLCFLVMGTHTSKKYFLY